jgi:hypothetical protein
MIGRQVGRYLITEELGRGGMGVVYRATHTTLNRTVAVKMLFPHLAKSGEYLGRFRREAVTLARLDHENIVHVYDIEEFDANSCIVMEYVGGPSLTRVLAQQRQQDPARVRDVAAGLASALSAAHRQGIIHRDIKPDNVLFTTDGKPKLTDFGIAHMRDDNVHTRTGIMLGTPLYMSPEQARGRPVTAASDIYSLGVMMYEMLTGQVPFQAADSVAIALMHVQDPPRRIEEIAPHVPAALAAVVHRMLEKDPAQRFSSGAALRETLLALTLGGARPQSPVAALQNEMPCPECDTRIAADFLTCPQCGLSVRQRCGECSRLYDPLSPECPYCRTPSTPTPQPAFAPGGAAPTEVPVAPGSGVGAQARAAALGVAAALGEAVGDAKQMLDEKLPTRTAIGRALHGARERLLTQRFAGLPLFVWAGVLLLALAAVAALASGGEDQRIATETAGSAESGAGSLPVAPVSGATGSPFPRREPAPAADNARINELLVGIIDSSARGKGGQDSAPQTESRVGAADSTGGAAASATSQSAPPSAAFNEAEARRAIESIIERQRMATEQADLDLLLEDVAPELHAALRESFAEMQKTARSVQSRITSIEVEFESPTQAIVTFRARVSGERTTDGRRVSIYDGEVEWELAWMNNRWLIVDAG